MPSRSSRLYLALSLLALTASACAGADPLTGTWTQPDATTPLPMALGGGDLNVDATLALDGVVSPGTFNLNMSLEAMGLTDSIIATGTYVDNGSDLTLTITGFVIDPMSTNMASIAEDGSQCILLQGFAGTPVCFRSPQTNAYVVGEESLTMVLVHEIAGTTETQTNLTLRRSL